MFTRMHYAQCECEFLTTFVKQVFTLHSNNVKTESMTFVISRLYHDWLGCGHTRDRRVDPRLGLDDRPRAGNGTIRALAMSVLQARLSLSVPTASAPAPPSAAARAARAASAGGPTASASSSPRYEQATARVTGSPGHRVGALVPDGRRERGRGVGPEPPHDAVDHGEDLAARVGAPGRDHAHDVLRPCFAPSRPSARVARRGLEGGQGSAGAPLPLNVPQRRRRRRAGLGPGGRAVARRPRGLGAGRPAPAAAPRVGALRGALGSNRPPLPGISHPRTGLLISLSLRAGQYRVYDRYGGRVPGIVGVGGWEGRLRRRLLRRTGRVWSSRRARVFHHGSRGI